MSLVKSRFHVDVANLVGAIIADKKLLKAIGNKSEFIIVAKYVAAGLPEVIEVMLNHRNIKFTKAEDAPTPNSVSARQATPFDQLFIGA